MPGMPYVMEQGTVLSVIDSYLSDQQHALDMLSNLLPQADGSLKPVVDAGGIGSSLLAKLPDPLAPPSQPMPTISARDHIQRDWFGPSAWWKNWQGDNETIVRWTMISAIQISLGLAHVGPDDPVPVGPFHPKRHWPIHVYWTCGSPMFQGWVSWHQHGPGSIDGVVNVFFSTPMMSKPLLPTPHDPAAIAAKGAGTAGNGYQDPAHTVGEHGLWVIGHDETRVFRSPTSFDTATKRTGRDVFPKLYGLQLVGMGPIVIVSPAESQGGVLPDGHPYQH